MSKWFETKKSGWGWYPSSWKGWTTVIIFILTIFSTRQYLELYNPENSTTLFLISIAFYSVLFTLIARMKS